jgi:hypothetical protein
MLFWHAHCTNCTAVMDGRTPHNGSWDWKNAFSDERIKPTLLHRGRNAVVGKWRNIWVSKNRESLIAAGRALVLKVAAKHGGPEAVAAALAAAEHAAAVAAAEAAAEAEIRAALGPAASVSSSRSAAAGSRRSRNSTGTVHIQHAYSTQWYCMSAYMAACMLLCQVDVQRMHSGGAC